MAKTDRLERYIAKLNKLKPLQGEGTKGSIRWNIKWYEDRYGKRRIAYRTVGVLALVGAASMPVAAWYGVDIRILAVPGVALIAAVSAFFSLKAAWSGYYLASFNLQHVLNDYKSACISARDKVEAAGTAEKEAATEEAIQAVKKAADQLFAAANKIINDETKGFFKHMKFPAVKVPDE